MLFIMFMYVFTYKITEINIFKYIIIILKIWRNKILRKNLFKLLTKYVLQARVFLQLMSLQAQLKRNSKESI